MGWLLAVIYLFCGIFFFRNSISASAGTHIVAWYVVLACFWPIFLVLKIIVAVALFINFRRGRL